MRKIVLSVAVSLDGYIEGPGGEYDWCFADQGIISGFLRRVDALLMGRKTYELALRVDGGRRPFPKKAHHVVSNTLREVAPWAELISGDVAGAVRQLKAGKGKDIWLFGGAELTRTLLEAGLLDELVLAVHPILLGAGKPLFGALSRRIKLTLVESRPYPSGLVLSTYAVTTEES